MASTDPTTKRIQYGERPTQPGMYIGLFHGRSSRNESMNDWGFAGPALGPLTYCHTTYMAYVRLRFATEEDAHICCNSGQIDVDLEVLEDMIFFDGAYYGDWTLFYVASDECRRADDSFRIKPRAYVGRWHNHTKGAQHLDAP